MAKRSDWSELKKRRLRASEAREAYKNAALSFALGEQVRKIREDKGLSQAALAQAMRTTQSAVARLEAGGTSPTIPTLRKLADALGVELILGFNDPRAKAGRRRVQVEPGRNSRGKSAATRTIAKTAARSGASKRKTAASTSKKTRSGRQGRTR